MCFVVLQLTSFSNELNNVLRGNSFLRLRFIYSISRKKGEFIMILVNEGFIILYYTIYIHVQV